MKKYRLNFALLNTIIPVRFSLPELSFKNNTKSSLLLKIVSIILILIVMGIVLALPFIPYVSTGYALDISIFRFLIYALPLTSGLYLITALFNGKRKFIDPPFFLAVLIFALATTTAAVLVAPTNINNTFGVSTFNFRGLAGVLVMFIVILFYLINIVAYNKLLLNRTLRLILLSLGFLDFALVLFSTQKLSDSNSLLISFVSVVAFTAILIRLRRLKLVALILFVCIVILNLNLFIFDARLYAVLFHLLLSGFITSLTLVIIFVMNKKEFLQKRLNEIGEEIKSFRKNGNDLINKLVNFIVLFIPVVLLIFLITLLVRNDYMFVTLGQKFNDISNAFVSLFSSSKPFLDVLVGNGGKAASEGNSFVTNIIKVQGLVGILAYLFVWVYGIRRALELFRNLINRSGLEYKEFIMPIFLIIFVPIYSLFAYPTLFLIILWWISFALMSARDLIYTSKETEFYQKEDWNVLTIKSKRVNPKIGLILKWILSLIIIAAAIYVSHSFLGIVK